MTINKTELIKILTDAKVKLGDDALTWKYSIDKKSTNRENQLHKDNICLDINKHIVTINNYAEEIELSVKDMEDIKNTISECCEIFSQVLPGHMGKAMDKINELCEMISLDAAKKNPFIMGDRKLNKVQTKLIKQIELLSAEIRHKRKPPSPPLEKGKPSSPPLQEEKPSSSPPLQKGNPSSPPLQKGNPSPPPLQEGKPSPPPLQKGNPSPPPLQEGNPSPPPLQEGKPSPPPLQKGKPSSPPLQEEKPSSSPPLQEGKLASLIAKRGEIEMMPMPREKPVVQAKTNDKNESNPPQP